MGCFNWTYCRYFWSYFVIHKFEIFGDFGCFLFSFYFVGVKRFSICEYYENILYLHFVQN